MRNNCLNGGKRGKRMGVEVRVIININRSILTSLTFLTSNYLLASIGAFSTWYNKILNLLSIINVFRSKRGKEVRAAFLLLFFLLPLFLAKGKRPSPAIDWLLPLPGGKA